MKPEELLTQLRQGSTRALGKLVSLVENSLSTDLPDDGMLSALESLYPHLGHSRVVAVTGPPGAGKSTLISALVSGYRAERKKVAVIAVDPVSPFTGGALLGDRIRLLDHFNDPCVFIRSLSTRGRLGGVSMATRQVLQLVDAAGFDLVLLETVGVGQSEVDAHGLSDVVVVTLTPEWGDGIQAIKAGILEIADLFAVNKSDRDGADRVVQELTAAMQMAGRADIAIVKTAQGDPTSITGLRMAIDSKLASSPPRADAKATAWEVLDWLSRRTATRVLEAHFKEGDNPYKVVAELRKKLKLD